MSEVMQYGNGETERPLRSGWRWGRLGDLTTKIGSGLTPLGGHATYQRSGIPLIRSQNVHFNRFSREGLAFVSVEQDAEMKTSRVEPGDVLLNITGASIGRVCVVPAELCPANVNQHVSIIRCKPDLSPHYLSLLISTPGFQKFISDTQAGATRQALTKSLIEEFRIPLLSPKEQERLAAKLTNQLATVERARTAAEVRLKAAQSLPAAYLREVFDSHGRRAWPKKILGDILALRKEVIHPYDSPSGSATFVGLEHVQSQTGVRIGAVETDLARLTGRKPQFRKGDIVYGYLRPYLNKVWVAEFDGICSVDQYVYCLKPDVADATFVSWFMRSPTFLNRAPVDQTPGQLPRIRTEEVAAVEIELPPIERQRRIAEGLTKQLATVAQARAAVESQLSAIAALPAALLRRAFQGELA